MTKTFYITTAIDYVNGQPHLGHAYEKIITDVITRTRMSLGQETYYLTGIDEHGQKVQQSAEAMGKGAQDYCDQLADDWRRFSNNLGLSNKGFIRTTDSRHKKVVSAILSKLHRNDHFYLAEYVGFYSTKEETFLTERDRLPDGGFDAAYGQVIELKENNYYFKLSDHQTWLIDYIGANPDFIYPEYRKNEVLGFLKNNTLEDLCISRPSSRLNWGIPLPFDPDYVTYVWFDALVNYVSQTAFEGDEVVLKTLGLENDFTPTTRPLWPADAHVIGKDILKFHAVYWPIMLKAMELPLPKQILAHGWWQKDGAKISKSTGNIVEPQAVIREWGLDAFRFYVIRELDLGPDGNWTDTGFVGRYHAELANGLGNLVNRSLSMLKKYRQSVVPAPSTDLAKEADRTVEKFIQEVSQFKLQAGLVTIWQLIGRANQYVDHTAPFKLAKDPSQSSRLDEVLYSLVETVRIIAILLHPYLPHTAERIFGQLGLTEKPHRFTQAHWGGLQQGHIAGNPEPLFPRKDLIQTQPITNRPGN